MLFVTGSDLYAAKNFLAREYGEEFKTSEVERGLPRFLENFTLNCLEIGADEKDGSIKYGVAFLIPKTHKRDGIWYFSSEKELYSYEDGLKKIKELKNKGLC